MTSGGRGLAITIALFVGPLLLFVVGVPVVMILDIDVRPIRGFIWLVFFPVLTIFLMFYGKERRQQQLRPYLLEVLAKEKTTPTP
jgi:hypothetical protein